MTTSPGTLQQSIASNKFYPPRITQSQSIPRHHIIADRLAADELLRKLVVIEAQAGQGKTTLVQQFLEFRGVDFVWYQIGSEDADPVLLLSALHLAVTRAIPEFTSPQLQGILEQGQVGPLDLQGCANILLNDMDAALNRELVIVFDDLHIIQESAYTNELIDYLIVSSPPSLHFILTSRHTLQAGAEIVRKAYQSVYLNSESLALDIGSVETLCHSVLGIEVSHQEAQEIRRITSGWIMGVVLAAQSIVEASRKKNEPPSLKRNNQLLAREKDGHILGYFEDEIFTHIPKNLHTPFMILSFLDEIDINLARVLLEGSDIGSQLDTMARENYFIYRLEGETEVFRLHHLFQEFLQLLARERLSPEKIGSIYRSAAQYYLDNHLVEKAMKALRSSSDFSWMEDILKEHGLQLLSANRTVNILEILKTIPHETLLSHSWLTFYHGLLSRDFAPQETLPFFESCRKRFAEEGEEVGELMSLSQLIYFHFVISGNYLTGSGLLERTRALFERNNKYLTADTSIMVARNLAAGYCVFDGEMELARHYAQMGCDLATRRDSKNFIAANRFVLGYIGLLSGNRRMARGEIEKSLALSSDPLVGMSNRLTLHIMQLCELSMHGNGVVFQHQKTLIQDRVDQRIVRQTVAAPYLFVWSAIALIGHGDPGRAIEVLEMGMQVSETAASAHMKSQFLQWRAMAHGLVGQEDVALSDIEESTRLREEAGGAFYIAYHLAIRGATLALTGKYDKAREALQASLQKGDSIHSTYPQACCLAYLASICLQLNETEEAVTHLRNWLTLMREQEYAYFWGWEPRTLELLLCEAVNQDIEPDFARMCARDRLSVSIDTDGTAIPLLEINMLDGFSISLGQESLFGPQDFSSGQRELFGILIGSPEQRISQEQVQLIFWPDSSPEKARNTFDTMMTRLRKTLTARLPVPATNYLGVEKGYVQLTNARIDGAEFIHAARQGFKLGRQGLWWQAGGHFYKALSLWQNMVPLETFYSDLALSFCDELQDTLRSVCLEWGEKLTQLHRIDEAIQILEKAGRLLASDEEYIGLLYRLYLKKHNPLKGRELLNSYRQELAKLEYSSQEIEEIIVELTEDRNYN